jgi:hypothetical protein
VGEQRLQGETAFTLEVLAEQVNQCRDSSLSTTQYWGIDTSRL